MSRGQAIAPRRLAACACAAVLGAASTAAPPPALAATLHAEGPAVVRALEAALLLSGQEGGAIRTAALAVAAPVDGEPAVRLLLEIDGAALLDDAAAGRPLDLFVYALDGAAEVVGTATRRLRLEPAHRPALERGGIRTSLELALPPGELTLRILVRAGESSFGIRSAPLLIPALEDGPHLLAPPIWPGSNDGWLATDVGAPARPLPAAIDGAPEGPPAALPVFGASATVDGMLLAAALPPAAEVDVTAQLKHNDSGELTELALGPTPSRATTLPGVDALPFRLSVAGLAPGLYTVRMTVELDGASLVSPSGVMVLSALPDEHRPWPALELDHLGADSSESLRAALPPAVETPGARLGRKAAGEALDAALERLAAGDAHAAGDRLTSLHRTARLSGSGVTLEQLREAEWARIERAAAAGWDAIEPLLDLYAGLADRYRRGRQIRLAEHAEKLTTRLAEAYAKRAQEPGAAERAAALLERLAATAMATGDPSRAVIACRDALRIGGDRPAALLGLGALLEKQGRAGDAVEVFERLVALEPDHAEARLRLALNRSRLGEKRRAAEELAQLAELPRPEWIARLAHQELARQRLAEGADRTAEELLRAGLERWPDEPSLAILLAWVLEADGRGGGDALLERIDRPRAGGDALPRYRYNAWPLPTSPVVATRPSPADRPGRR